MHEFATHPPESDLFLEVADYVYLLNRGRVPFAGEACEVDADAIAAEYVGAGH